MTDILKSIEETCRDINAQFSSTMKNIDDKCFHALVYMAKSDLSFRNLEILENYLMNIQDKLILIKSFLNLLEQVSNKIPDIDSLLGAKKNIKNINQG
jgi:hypothetical protein